MPAKRVDCGIADRWSLARLAVASLVASALLISAFPASAADTPHGLWVKAKCALCHGDDGSGNTPAGKSKKVPDLRSEEIQKRTDEELTAAVNAGHGSMPSFHTQLSREQVALLVGYIRGLAKPK